MKGKNYYRILGVSKDATKAEIKSAYRKLAKQYHPDVNQDDDAEEMFKKITEAYQTLIDDDLREEYDRELRANRASSSSSNKQSTNNKQQYSYNYNYNQQYSSYYNRSYNYNNYSNNNNSTDWITDFKNWYLKIVKFLYKAYAYCLLLVFWPITLPIYFLYRKFKKKKQTTY